MGGSRMGWLARLVAAGAALAALGSSALAVVPEPEEHPRSIKYETAPPAPAFQLPVQAAEKSAGCLTCHTATDQHTMHVNPGVVLGCTDCHGGKAEVKKPEGAHYAGRSE